MFKFLIHSLFLGSFFYHPIFAAIDLEKEFAQNFVLETKKIEIPGYPHAFNPSIIRWKDRLLLSFRVIPNPKQSFNSLIGLVWLDKDFHSVGEPQMLNLREDMPLIPSRAEDARLLSVDQALYIVYSDNQDEKITKGGFRLFIGELEYNGEHFFVKNPECLSRFDKENKNRREKNWVPFDYYGCLLLGYSLVPHLIISPLRGMGTCETLAESQSIIEWNWGELRGGTPAFLHEEDEYLAFFHSSKKMVTAHSNDKEMPHYFMGAYTFSAHFPFAITKISPLPIVSKGFYNGPLYSPYWGSVRAIFPGGYIYDENFIWIAYGRADHEVWIAKVDKKALFESLIPVINRF